MTIAHAPVIRPQASPDHADAAGRLLVGISLLMVVLVAAAGLAAWRTSEPSENAVRSALLASARTVDAHAAAMIEHAGRLAQSAQAVPGPQRDHWSGDAEHMIADGRGLLDLAQRIRARAARLGEAPLHRSVADLSIIRVQAAALRADGEAAIAHGRVMVDHGLVMADLARQPGSGILASDAALMSDDAERIVSVGAELVRIATMLTAAADRFEHSLGLPR